ncbi:pseudouridine synthase [Solimonas marina]|uniref:Pseudouridine synthase n=1 Tax=Solimonas marina TaxID=2714601 RepID=A0A969W6I2_9GAMM|nr:pseudouridine synthase [Solimonas marina]NKF20848.1 pseudouridine synthase [Solimonas marina]
MPAAPLPPRDGVGASSVQLPDGPWPRVLDFLVDRFAAIDVATWRARMARGLVVDEHGAPIDEHTPYRAGVSVSYYRELPSEAEIPFVAQILYRDAHLLIADKPHFLPVIPAGRYVQQSLLVRLKRETGLAELTPLHRIDRGTAGLVAFSTNAQTRGRYQALFATRAIDKRYDAIAPQVDGLRFPFARRSRLVAGTPFFRMQEADGTPNSETIFESAEPHGALARYRLQLLSGKKHQLRVHLAAIGAPIENDPFYPTLRDAADEDDFDKPLKLLARRLAFVDPLNGETRVFTSQREL